ncbi:transcription factor bHLH71 [Aristolochia californica]|uniref:transcription factor bHLH71 n=1 Tax=Aristolochia californica TaxID=171875 RepID=UPI0035DA1208
MALDALASNDLSSFIIYDTICASEHYFHDSWQTNFLLERNTQNPCLGSERSAESYGKFDGFSTTVSRCLSTPEPAGERPNSSTQGRKKRRRRPRICLNKEEAETQRMTHIAVERNRRKQMNEHLAVLRSLMPESYVQRGDQASVVGGAIDFVKELEQLLQSLEAEKRQLQQQNGERDNSNNNNNEENFIAPPFMQFFAYPQYSWSQLPNENPKEKQPSVAEIEVTLIETHANLRILSKRRPKQLAKMVAGFHSLRLTILHLTVTTLDPFVLYSISVKVEEGCNLNSVDEIAGAAHHMLTDIAEEAALS